MIYLSLFFTALIAATLFPLSSEALLVTLLYQHYSPLLLWLVATSGNTLGSCINWYLGKECLRWQDKKWFPFRPEQLARAQQQFQRYGLLSLLFAGVMRIRFWQFLVLVAMGKSLRYAAIIAAALGLINQF
jgi:membrane protein YqaA with SNARE-associated domain